MKYIKFLSCSRHKPEHFREDEDGWDFLCESNTGKRNTQRTLVPDRYENVLRYTHTKIHGDLRRKKFHTFRGMMQTWHPACFEQLFCARHYGI